MQNFSSKKAFSSFVSSLSYSCGIYHKVLLKVSQNGYISAVTYQKAFIFGPYVPWRVFLHSIYSSPRVHAPERARGRNIGHF